MCTAQSLIAKKKTFVTFSIRVSAVTFALGGSQAGGGQ